VFGTRWAQSFLAGPLTREQVSSLTDPGEISTPDAQPSVTPEAETAPIPDDTVALMPDIADGIDVSFVTDSTPWLEAVGADSSGSTLSPVVAATVDLLYDDQYADVSHTEEFEAIIAPVDDVVTSENLHIVDHDARDFTDAQPPGAGFAILDEKIQNKTWWRDLESSLKEYLYRNRSVTVFKNPDLKLYSRIGESESEFTDRCRTAAEDAADEAAAALRDKYEARLERVKDQLRAAERRVDELEVDVSSRKQQEVLGGVGDLLGSLFGGKRTTTALKGAASRRSQVRRIQERLETAEAKVADKADDIVELEADLADDILEITSEWEDKAENIETVEIGLEKTDISVRELRLAWVRTAD